MSLTVQFYLLTHTILYGIFVGLCFDTFDMFIRQLKQRICRHALIILYWSIQLPLAILFFHRINRGEFQSYLLFFVLLGGLIYFKLFKKKYMKELKTLIEMCYKVCKCIKNVLNILIFKPILFIFRLIFDIMVLPKKFFGNRQQDKSQERDLQNGEIQSHQE